MSGDVDRVVGGNLRRFREARDLTVEALAALANITAAEIAAYEAGTQRLEPDRLYIIATCLAVTIGDMFSIS